ncbi:MAG: hypothetical protein LBQ69_05455 [Treponema sp.]|nr:hypothetical protein [Treponema sp.]
MDGKQAAPKPEKPGRPKNRQGRRPYTDGAVACLRTLWAFCWYNCGKYPAPAIRGQMPFLQALRKPNFAIAAETNEKLLKTSPATISRYLKADKDALRGETPHFIFTILLTV